MAELLKVLRTYLVLGVLAIAVLIAYRLGTTYSWKTAPEEDTLMAPLLKSGAMFRMDRRAVDKPLERGAVVAYQKDPRDPDAFLLGRIVGLPGERVAVKDGAVLVDGEVLSEPGRASPTLGKVPEIRIPRGYYFVLVDERNDGRFNTPGANADSRDFGPVAACRMLGKLAH